MVLVTKARPSATNALQQRITALDRSTELASAQIYEAFSLLAIDPGSVSSTYSQKSSEEESHHGFGPKEEWVLRWLLKRFEGDTVQSESIHIEPEAWTLLRIVVARLPTTIVARHLSAFNFTITLQKTLQWLAALAQALPPPTGSYDSGSPSQASLSGQSSSSATVQEAPSMGKSKSKKRKRDETTFADNAASPSAFPLHRVYLCICGALRQVQAHAVSTAGDAEGFAVEHIKAAMKTSVDQGAKILGNALEVLKRILVFTSEEAPSPETYDSDFVLNPITSIWTLRSTVQGAADSLASAKAFSESCLLPALLLLIQLKALPHVEYDTNSLSQRIKMLLAAHIILPGRAVFIRAKDPKLDTDPISIVSELLAPLSKALQGIPSLDARSGLLGDAIPILFEFAIRLMPRDTPKQRTTEDPWLRALFLQLAECLSFHFPITQDIFEDDLRTDIVERMLRLVVHSNLSLETPILRSIVSHISGIHRANPQHRARWSLIGLCMKINSDMVLPVRTKSNLATNQTTTQSNTLLEKILAKLTLSGFKVGAQSSDDYEDMLHEVVLPILESFIRARDLEGFINVLKQQLIAWMFRGEIDSSSQEHSDKAVSIWEDEILLHAVSSNLESALTAGQILRILQSITATVDSVSVLPSKEEQSMLYAEILVLDTVVDGTRNDQVVSTCKLSVESTGHTLSILITNEEKLLDYHRWRVWRALATISERFSYYTEDCIRKAQEKLTSGLSREMRSTGRPVHFQEALFALSYLVSSCQGQGYSSLIGVISEVMVLTVRIAAATMAATTDEIINSAELPAESCRCPVWDGKNEAVADIRSLLVACAAQLVLAPTVLVAVESAVLAGFTEFLYRQATIQAHLRRSLDTDSSEGSCITFITLWERLLQTAISGDHPSVTKAVHKSVLKSFLGIGGTGGSHDKFREHDFAIVAVHRLSLSTFEYGERKAILHYTSTELLNIQKLRLHAQYLALLVHSLEHPQKSMQIKLSEPSYLWQLADVLDSCKSSPVHGGILVSFRQLVLKVMNFILQEYNRNQNTSFLDSILNIWTQKVAALEVDPVAPANTILLAAILRSIWVRSGGPSRTIGQRRLSTIDISQLFFQWLPHCLPKSRSELESWKLAVIHDGLETFLRMLQNDLDESASNISIIQCLITETVQSVQDLALADIPVSQSYLVKLDPIEDLVVTIRKVTTSLSSDSLDVATLDGIKALETFKTTRAKRAWLRYLAECFWEVDTHLQAGVITKLAQTVRTEESGLLYFQRILNHTYDKASNIKPALSQLFSELCCDVCTMSSTKCCVFGMYCLDLMMKKNAWTISQWHIDTLLSTITRTTSRSGPPLPMESPDIFMCMCRLFGTMLALHRSKLGGRYHLVVMALQGMLRCLFIPYTASANSSHSLERPPWLINSRLDQTHASAYARLLTSICDPSVSAVTRSKNRQRQELNDETKKARSIAGQHLQYLIMEFCQCQLRGRMEPEVRAALNPGLYAVFDAMSQDVMRTVNAALDSAGRAIFKVLYDDYRRFGRWHGA